MKQIILTKGGRVVCVTTVPYPKETIRAMKAAGYKIKEEQSKEDPPANVIRK